MKNEDIVERRLFKTEMLLSYLHVNKFSRAERERETGVLKTPLKAASGI